ncbi:MAG: hypothetical protein ABI321_24860 [Polyangia bacterium]
MASRTTTLALSVFLVGSPLLCGPAQAQTPAATDAAAPDYDLAGKQFAAGQESFAAKRFHVAALHFQAAYDITKDPVLLFNVGESYENAGNAQRASDSYRAYLAQKPTAQDRADIEKRIARLDDKKAAPLPDRSIDGDRAEADKIVASGTVPATDTAVTATPSPAPSPDPVAAPATPPAPPAAVVVGAQKPAQVGLLEEHPATRLRVAAWSGVAATLALLTTGAILGLAAQSRGDEVTRRLSFVDSTGQPLTYDAAAKADFSDLRSQGKLYSGLSIGFYTASAAMAVVTTTLFLVDWRKNKKRDRKLAASAFVAAPMVAPHAGGLVAGGSF